MPSACRTLPGAQGAVKTALSQGLLPFFRAWPLFKAFFLAAFISFCVPGQVGAWQPFVPRSPSLSFPLPLLHSLLGKLDWALPLSLFLPPFLCSWAWLLWDCFSHLFHHHAFFQGHQHLCHLLQAHWSSWICCSRCLVRLQENGPQTIPVNLPSSGVCGWGFPGPWLHWPEKANDMV